jgi:hypothetical protein
VIVYKHRPTRSTRARHVRRRPNQASGRLDILRNFGTAPQWKHLCLSAFPCRPASTSHPMLLCRPSIACGTPCRSSAAAAISTSTRVAHRGVGAPTLPGRLWTAKPLKTTSEFPLSAQLRKNEAGKLKRAGRKRTILRTQIVSPDLCGT